MYWFLFFLVVKFPRRRMYQPKYWFFVIIVSIITCSAFRLVFNTQTMMTIWMIVLFINSSWRDFYVIIIFHLNLSLKTLGDNDPPRIDHATTKEWCRWTLQHTLSVIQQRIETNDLNVCPITLLLRPSWFFKCYSDIIMPQYVECTIRSRTTVCLGILPWYHILCLHIITEIVHQYEHYL